MIIPEEYYIKGCVYMDSGVVIQQLNHDDEIRVCAQVIRDSFMTVANEYNITYESCPTYAAFRTFEDIKAIWESGVKMFALFEQGTQAGFVCIADNGGNSYIMGLLSVLPQYRHKGYGKKLMDFVYDYVKSQDGKKVQIWLMNENSILKEWYRKYGFIETGIRQSDGMPFTICDMEIQTA